MSQVQVIINNKDVSQFIDSIGDLTENSDQSNFFAGVYQRSNVAISFNNQSGFFNEGGALFPLTRNNVVCKLVYIANDPQHSYEIFDGVIDEASTQNDLSRHMVSLEVLDTLKLLKDVDVGEEDLLQVENGLENNYLNENLIRAFLGFFIRKGNLNLSYDVGITIGSIFPPDDVYYDSVNLDALSVLTTMVSSCNSFFQSDGNQILIKPRPRIDNFKLIKNHEIIDISNQTNGFNKVFNAISINSRDSIIDQASVDLYGVQRLSVSSFAPPSQLLAQSYFDYYSNPKEEMDLTIRMNVRNLGFFQIGDSVKLDIPSSLSNSVQKKEGNYFVIRRDLNFSEDLITLRLREV